MTGAYDRWSDEKTAQLLRLHADGYSLAQIAKRLGGISRNAVGAKLVRMGVTGKSHPAAIETPVVQAPTAPRKFSWEAA